MADDSTPAARSSKVSRKLPIKGMENVVATVTGYTGLERFNLIKLISLAGGNYVGRMSRSVTHLVCWKYDGTKYKLARQFETLVVNHQWIEDCIKEGRRLPEDPYTLQCGQQVGPLSITIPFSSDVVRHPRLQNDRNENLLPKLEQSRHRLKRKISRGSPKQENSSASTYRCTEPYSPSIQREEIEVLHSPQHPIFLSQKKGKSASLETSRRSHRRRLVKKNMRKETLDIISDSEEEMSRQKDFHEQYCSGAVSNSSVQGEECRLSARVTCDSTGYQSGQKRSEALTNMQDIDNVIDVLDIHDDILDVNGASSYHVRDADANGNDIEQSTRLPASTELSCVICWTEFSATRGLLPCGHRFCFSCIQSWADHATSSRKTSTCPLCKASFVIITKVDNAVSSDQKIYSQTVPHDDPRMGIYILDGGEAPSIPSSSSGAPVCCHCSRREPEDLLERCDVCQIQRVHIFCLDPPAFPWICANCKDLQRLYLYRR
ncbi:uncharacterized protein LOC113754212 [Coffea eugenioides]|uniref:uncharacterized protein LOC113754212 n=1 Tax=Coffea eugenioides TaxID=49369 RepID=UPI000F615E56|nr:uncharacterized protein LOC113754212 [Coffea eugenioides]